LKEQEDLKALARQRMILDVLAQRMTATQAALELGVSRKTYYEWQARGLAGMQAALEDRPWGRPPLPVDPQKEELQATVTTLEKERQVLQGRLRIMQAVQQTWNELQAGAPPKKKGPV